MTLERRVKSLMHHTSFRSRQAFFRKGKAPKGLYTALNSQRRGINYRKDHRKYRNKELVLDNYITNPRRKKENPIKSSVSADEHKLQATAPHMSTGDETTWCRAGVRHRREYSREPPMEVEDKLTQHRRQGMELLPANISSR